MLKARFEFHKDHKPIKNLNISAKCLRSPSKNSVQQMYFTTTHISPKHLLPTPEVKCGLLYLPLDQQIEWDL